MSTLSSSSLESNRVALVADQLQHLNAGTESQMLALYQGLCEAGWQPQLYVLRGAKHLRALWPGAVAELGIIRMASPRSWWRAWRFARDLRNDGVRLAHLFFNDTSVLLPPFLRAAGVRVIVSRRDMGFWYTPGTLRLLRVVGRWVDRVIANSQAVKTNVAAEEGIDPGRIEVIYNGAVLDFLGAGGSDVSAETPVIGLVANIRPVKRIGDAIAALARIRDRHPRAVLEVVGGGDPEALRKQADVLGIGDRVRFVGQVENPRARLAGYQVCLLTSESEGLSNAVIEYLLDSRAVICSDTGGNPELVQHDETGLLYPVADIEELAAHLDRLLSDAALRRRLGGAGRARARKLFDPGLMVQRHVQVYREVLAGEAVRSEPRGAFSAGKAGHSR